MRLGKIGRVQLLVNPELLEYLFESLPRERDPHPLCPLIRFLVVVDTLNDLGRRVRASNDAVVSKLGEETVDLIRVCRDEGIGGAFLEAVKDVLAAERVEGKRGKLRTS